MGDVSGDGVEFEGIRFPGTIRISEPSRESVRLEVEAIVPVNAPAAAFSPVWLLTPPVEPPSELASPEP